VEREHAFDAFAVADAAHGESLIETAAALAHDNARENLDAFLVAFDDLGVHFHRVADGEFCVVFTKLFRFNFFQ